MADKTTTEQSVELALAELREMFPGRSVIVSAFLCPNEYSVAVAAQDEYELFSYETLSECMDQVRRAGKGVVMGSRGLWKLHHAAQTAQAKRDFAALVTMAVNAGRADLVKKHFYPEGAGWRVIDKHLTRLRTALAEQAKKES